MTVGSLFSGIGGFDLAAERSGMEVAWQVENEPFASKILAARFPNMERFGDVRAADPLRLRPVDLLCGGWPCQGNSVAGKRQGHADERSGLFSEILRIVDGMDPRPGWILLENVGGLVSVNGGRDFRSVVAGLRGRGYVGCVRRLDAQYFGLAQRRKRLFFVCGIGAAGVRAVQLVTEGGHRYPAPRREEGTKVAGSIGAGFGRNRGLGQVSERDMLACHSQRREPSAETYVTHSLRGEGFDASEDGAGRGTPLVALGISNDPSPKIGDQIMPTLQSKTGGGGSMQSAFTGRTVRRLTPTECERLQGFPDGWTCLCGRNDGRSVGADPCRCPDGPRYRTLGNAVPPVMVEWLMKRINLSSG